MDKLSQFLVETFQPKPKTAALSVPIKEPTFLEKRAYNMAIGSMNSDMEFLKQFEGTPLAPQAVALAEQELAMEQQQLQKRMQRTAERKMDDTWDQDCIQQDAIRLQKQQLLLQLYKMKAMTPASQPGDAVIGTPQLAAPQLGSEIGGGVEGNAPVAEQGPKLAAFVRSFVKRAGRIDDEAAKMMRLQPPNKHFARSVSGAGVVKTSASPGIGTRRGASEEAVSDDAKASMKISEGLHPLYNMPSAGASWDEQAYEDLLLHGDDPRLPAAARKAILQHHINKVVEAPIHTPEAALAEAQSAGRWTGGALGALGGLGLGGTVGALVRQPGLGLALGGVGGGLLGAHLGKKHLGTPEAASQHIERAQKFQEAMKALQGNDLEQENLLGEMLRHRMLTLEGHDDTWTPGRKKAAISKFASVWCARRAA